MNPTQNPVATAAAAGGVATSLAIMLMYAMNAIWHITFPPEVSVAFTTVVTWLLHLVCVKLGCGIPTAPTEPPAQGGAKP